MEIFIYKHPHMLNDDDDDVMVRFSETKCYRMTWSSAVTE